MRRKYVLAGFALVAAVAIASPALGGPSLKKLVKKEVTKQLAGKSGPQGTSGPQGPAGTNGTNGQSVASANEPTGTANCSGRGGSKFTAANGVTFACNGANGSNGQSVASANEPTGTANCGGRGGSKFTAANGVTYACNGTNGTNGTNGATNVNQRNASLPVNAGATNDAVASCDAGDKATGGGYAQATSISEASIHIGASRPELTSGVPTGWHVYITNSSASNGSWVVFVVCASP
jgi:hypothetical protein